LELKRPESLRAISRIGIAAILIGLIIIGLVSGLGALSPYFGKTPSTTGTSSAQMTTSSSVVPPFLQSISSSTVTSVLWSSLHGVDYAWFPLGQQCCSNGPAVDFPIIKSLGFNLIRLPLSWNTFEENPSAYIGYLTQVANEADSLGMHVIYDAHTNANTANLVNASQTSGVGGAFFPVSLFSTYGTGNAFFYAWWTGNVTYNGEPGWNALWSDFWVPIVQAVNSHPSTLGYEIENEPNPGYTNYSYTQSFQSFNQFMANHLQSMTNKYIVFMGPFEGLSPSADEQVAPKGIAHLVMDAHCYISESCSNLPTDLAEVASVGSSLGIPIWIGEWAVCTPNCYPSSQSVSASIVQEYVSAFKQYGFANTYWMWKCASDLSLLGATDLLGPYPACQTNWLDTQISQAEQSY
jgi:Cellulase (glycosyl hydrolase family 5)